MSLPPIFLKLKEQIKAVESYWPPHVSTTLVEWEEGEGKVKRFPNIQLSYKPQ